MKFKLPILIILFITIVFCSGCADRAHDNRDEYVSPYAKYINTTEYKQGYEKGVREQADMQKRSDCHAILVHQSVNDSDMAFCYGYLHGQEHGAELAEQQADQQAMTYVRTNSTGYDVSLERKSDDNIIITYTANNTSNNTST
jgi:hypothetical protein